MQAVGGGNSSSFIFVTENSRFVIKTIQKDEIQVLLEILPAYSKRLIENKHSYLVKIFGLFTIFPEEISVMIMENLFPSRNDMIIFDLKGSLANRMVEFLDFPSPGETLKDQNFLDMGIHIQASDKDEIVKCLESDFALLASFAIMDYSIVIGIPIRELMESRIIRMDKSIAIGIIDILQKFNSRKQYEKKFKSLVIDPEKLSSIDSLNYFTRIRKFLNLIFIN